MDEILTTGELIDRLKVNEYAQVVDDPHGMVEGQKIFNNGYRFLWVRGDSDFNIHDGTRFLKWRILPKQIEYVSYIDAINAFKKQGKTIRHYIREDFYRDYYWENGIPKCKDYNGNEHTLMIHFAETLEDKWGIVD